ncbi:MAG: conjugal transfer protein TraT [Gammaproteobacteria bacterium]|nr:conjugal transfer protein TraT [Gammaproteobacteria bacterium]
MQNSQVKGLAAWAMTATLMLALYGCGATYTLIKKRNLDVQTKMSETVFLEPVRVSEKIIYVSVRNTTDKTLNIKQKIVSELLDGGYSVTREPDEARFMLQANVLKLGKGDLRSSESYLEAGFGGAIIGGVAGAAISGSSRDVAVGGVIGAIGAVVGDALVEDTLFIMVTDLQVRERPREGEVVEQRQHLSTHQGTSTGLQQRATGGNVNWKTYRTRIVSNANKANLEFDEARPELEKGLIRSISGIFREE